MTTEEYLFSSAVKVISFDFDDTLALSKLTKSTDPNETRPVILFPSGYWISEDVPNPPIVDLAKRLHNVGKELHIVTYRTHGWAEECYEFCKKCGITIKAIHATAGNSKVTFLQKIKADCHIDDDIMTCTEIFNTDITPILVKQPCHTSNSTLKLFKYIL